jgi:GNAT superfamily N-acetyltransferase
VDGRAATPTPLRILVRRATTADTDAVARFTRGTWDGWDYIADVWSSWLDARDGVVLAVERDDEPGRPIAIARATLLSDEEAWLEGLRVDAEFRGRGVAIALQFSQLAWAQAQGVSIVRYATGETNRASLHLGGKHGLVEAGRWRALRPEAVGDGRHAAAADDTAGTGIPRQEIAAALEGSGASVVRVATDVDGWSQQLEADDTFRRGGGLYEWRAWAWQRLDAARLARHAARSELLVARDGADWSLGLIAGERLRGEVRVALLGGAAGPARRIVDAVTATTGRRPIVRLPDESPLLRELGPSLADDGWRVGEHVLVLMGRRLREENGKVLALPIEGADRVTFLEPPRDLGLVPAD